ncbi:hypothetical protein ACIOYV_11590 [Pseudomonas sp. NPDC087342]|uniref:hypothetical protein n=1 Tax=Pseudomonas sp. NPDC087342 TaxID=3364437 RepID=UPI003804C090
MSRVSISSEATNALTSLAKVLIPGTDTMPAIDQLPMFESLIQVAVKSCGYTDEQIELAISNIPGDVDWVSAKKYSEEMPESFNIAATLASAAYLMAPPVLEGLKFPTDRRHPADVEDFLQEYDTGILEEVTNRGPRFRHTERTPK